MTTDLRVGPIALALMHHFEACKLVAYRCPANVPTIGRGNTYYLDGQPVRMGDRITQQQADDLFAAVLERDFASPVRVELSVAGAAATTPAQFGAMVTLAYNIGMGPRAWQNGLQKGFRQSEVLRLHRAGNYVSAGGVGGERPTPGAFGGWVRARGKVSNGLVRRRNAEAALYRSDFAALERFTNGEVKA